jgi:hypothetical protein
MDVRHSIKKIRHSGEGEQPCCLIESAQSQERSCPSGAKPIKD